MLSNALVSTCSSQLNMSNTNDSPGMEVPSHRACAHCRSQKGKSIELGQRSTRTDSRIAFIVRCIMDETNPDVCQRCARSGRPCVFTPLQKRKQRKRTDTRVAELEREMRTMRAMLKNKQGGKSESTQKATTGQRPKGVWFAVSIQKSSFALEVFCAEHLVRRTLLMHL